MDMDLPTTRHDMPQAGKTPDSASQNSKNQDNSSGKRSGLKKASLYILLATLFLAPLAFIPSAYVSLDIVKITIISSGILISGILYTLSALKSRSIAWPRSAITCTIIGIIISILISSFLSTNVMKSLFGQGFEIWTASFIILMFLGTFLVSRLSSENKEVIFNVYITILLSSIVLMLFHIARILGGADFMKFGILNSSTSSLIGKWYDLAILIGMTGLLSFFGIKFLSLGKGLRSVLYVILIISGLFLFIMNFKALWFIMTLVFLAVLFYEYKTKISNSQGIGGFFSKISIFTLIMLIISGALYFKGDLLASPSGRALNTGYTEVVLPWRLTLDVTSDTIKESPFFGAGPNRFTYQFLKFKPYQDINPSPFWNAEFSSGFGIVPSFVASQGLVGAILWCLFFIFLIREGVRALKRPSDPLRKFFISSSFFVSVFLWAMDTVYVPSHVIVFLTFIFTGLFLSALSLEGLVQERNIGQGKGGKFVPLAFSIIIILLIVWLGFNLKKTIAIAYFQSGIKELNTTKDLDKVEKDFKKALSLDRSDIYYQALSETDIMRVSDMAQNIQSKTGGGKVAPEQKDLEAIQNTIKEALDYTKKAEAIDPNNYYNYVAEARVSELGASLQINGAYENAKQAYANAVTINPYNPALYLSVARLEVTKGNLNDAQYMIGRALQLKQNYTDAIFLLSQIQASSGQIKDAITSVTVATQINPNDQTLFFQLGLLYYNNKDYGNAAGAFEKALSIDSQYANAKYFLGLSYVRIGKMEEAVQQFEDLAKTNPDSQEVAFILSNLREGKSPFADAKPPIDSKPEKRKSLPIKESSSSSKSEGTN